MRFLITGGAGFIGSHLSELLLAQGDRVLVLDDLSTGSMANLEFLKGRKGFDYRIDSIENEPVLAETIDEADAVFHLAAAVGVRLVVEEPVRTIETNILGTRLVLKHANKKKKPVLLTSTSEIYGKSAAVPFREDSDMVFGPTTHSRWSYACSKAIDEFLALSYWREKRQPVVIVRLFNTVGPRQVGRYGMVIPRFVGQALSGGPITVYGDGTQSRCFCDVTDVVAALDQLLRDPAAYGEVYNVGSDGEVSILALAERVRALVDPKVAIKLVPYDEAYGPGFEDMVRRVPDVSKLKKKIGFSPRHDLDSILARVIEHLSTHP
ncbi:MAG: GDP-mannose 4,6-dehydratase [Planctomycetes bacterium]|nr:GDP-mannose 4,6-dehydratase [Planctomycetota bacterium]